MAVGIADQSPLIAVTSRSVVLVVIECPLFAVVAVVVIVAVWPMTGEVAVVMTLVVVLQCLWELLS